MKSVMWACVVAGLLLIGSVVPADAAGGGSRGGYHGGRGGWTGGAPRGSAWISGGGYRSGGTYAATPRGSAWVSGGYRGSYHRGGGWYGGTRVYIGGGVGWWGPGWWGRPGWWGPGWWGWPGWWGTGYWGYGWWGPPYPYYAAPPVTVHPAPTTYIQQEPTPPADGYWYYCEKAKAYYPYVKDCPGGWMQVVPQSAPPDR